MRTGQLLFKLYLGCLLTVLVAIGLSFLYFAQFRKARQLETSHLVGHFVTDLAQHRKDSAALRAEVVRLKQYARINVSLYAPDGRLLASTVDPALPMVANSDRARLAADGPARLANGQFA